MNRLFKRLFILIVLFISVFCVSSVKAATEIEVTNISIKEKNSTITVVDPVLENNNITSNIKFNQKDDYVTFELTLKNNSSTNKYKVTSITDNNSNTNLELDYGYGNDYIEIGSTGKVTLTITYKNTLLNQDKISLDDLTITFNFEGEDGTSTNTTINPNTGDNIIMYFGIVGISLIGLFICIRKGMIKSKKVLSIIVLALVLIPINVLAKEELSISIKFNDIEVIGEYEVYHIGIDSRNGESITYKDVTYGEEIGELPTNPIKDGYVFVKWVDGDGNTVTSNTIITSEISVLAAYNELYDITIEYNGGTATNVSSYTVESDDITLNNPTKDGYTFTGWTGSNGENPELTVTIPTGSTGDKSYVANYTPDQDTPYKVLHIYQNLDLTTYTENEVTNYGETDSTVPAPRVPQTGFITPDEQNVTITAGEQSTITYVYNRESYTVYFNMNGGTAESSQTIIYGQKVTKPSSDPTKDGYVFDDWYTDDDWDDLFDFNSIITSDTVIYARFKKDLYTVVFSEPGTCIFNGSTGVITGDTCSQANGERKYIDTGINLYDKTNYGKDFEIGFTIDSYDYTEQEESQSTIMNAKLEGNNYPGVVFRKLNKNNNQLQLSSRSDSSTNTDKTFTYSSGLTVKIYRIYNEDTEVQEIFYSINGGEKIWVNDLSEFNPIFNLSVWFGAAPTDLDATGARRYFTGTLSNMYIKLGAYNQEDKYDVSFDTNGGSSIESQIVKLNSTASRPGYIPYKEGYEFVDWYADSELTTLYDFTTPITDDTVIYAKYVESNFALVFNHTGECTFNGADGVLTGDNCAFADGFTKFIDTGVSLYNTANHDKDYEIGFTIVSYDADSMDNQATFMNTKSEETGYPGVVFRKRPNLQEFDLSSRKTSSANESKFFAFGTVDQVKIYRIYNQITDKQEIYYSINGGSKLPLNDLSSYNPTFDLSVWFGATPKNAYAKFEQRYLTGTLSNMYIKLGTYNGD